MPTRLTLVAAADDDRIYALNQVKPSGSWSDWVPLGAPAGEQVWEPTLSASADGRLELFAFSKNHNRLWHRWQTAKYGSWSAWTHVSDPPSVTWKDGILVVAPGQDGRLELFSANGWYRDHPLKQPGNDVWHIFQTKVNRGWSPWQSHGQPPDADQLGLHLSRNSDGRLVLFADVTSQNADGDKFHTWCLPQTHPNGQWGAWQRLKDYPNALKPVLRQTIGCNADGRLEIFAVDPQLSGTLWHLSQLTPSGPWSDWENLGKPPGRFLDGRSLVVATAFGRLEVFASANTIGGKEEEVHDEIWHVRQTAPNNGWTGWDSLGSPGGNDTHGSTLAVANSDDGRLELFATSDDGILWHRWQIGHTGSWSTWTNRGVPAGTRGVYSFVLHAS